MGLLFLDLDDEYPQRPRPQRDKTRYHLPQKSPSGRYQKLKRQKQEHQSADEAFLKIFAELKKAWAVQHQALEKYHTAKTLEGRISHKSRYMRAYVRADRLMTALLKLPPPRD
jgi:hypothetical protein